MVKKLKQIKNNGNADVSAGTSSIVGHELNNALLELIGAMSISLTTASVVHALGERKWERGDPIHFCMKIVEKKGSKANWIWKRKRTCESC